ncbi:hypothetical protein PLICRDRAFT_175051 [Plicaturopsis crispa FD-325 SS-3]|nr:hypothetical protein PLICRDRAFT_175051 [Plicaturopsis crispa FD-325 SS-3]
MSSPAPAPSSASSVTLSKILARTAPTVSSTTAAQNPITICIPVRIMVSPPRAGASGLQPALPPPNRAPFEPMLDNEDDLSCVAGRCPHAPSPATPVGQTKAEGKRKRRDTPSAAGHISAGHPPSTPRHSRSTAPVHGRLPHGSRTHSLSQTPRHSEPAARKDAPTPLLRQGSHSAAESPFTQQSSGASASFAARLAAHRRPCRGIVMWPSVELGRITMASFIDPPAIFTL